MNFRCARCGETFFTLEFDDMGDCFRGVCPECRARCWVEKEEKVK